MDFIKKIIETCNNHAYDDSLTNLLVNFFKSITERATVKQKQKILDALANCEIKLLDNPTNFAGEIENHCSTNIEGYKLNAFEKLAISVLQKGIYFPIPNINRKEISRLILVLTSEKNVTSNIDDETRTLHELIHLLRSFDNSEFLFSDKDILGQSGLMQIYIQLANGKIDILNSRKTNIQAEQNLC